MNKLAIIAGTALLGASAIGLAGEYTPPAPVGLGDYAYIGLELGASQMFFDTDRFTTNFADDENDGWGFGGRVFAGYLWKAAEKFYAGLELGFSMYDGSEYKNTTTNPTGSVTVYGYHIDLLGVAKYNFTDNFNAFVKAGVAYAWQNFDLDNGITLGMLGMTTDKSTTDDSVTDSAFVPKAVAGLGYDFNNNFGLTLSYSYLFGTDSPDNTDDIISVGSLYLGAIYRFV